DGLQAHRIAVELRMPAGERGHPPDDPRSPPAVQQRRVGTCSDGAARCRDQRDGAGEAVDPGGRAGGDEREAAREGLARAGGGGGGGAPGGGWGGGWGRSSGCDEGAEDGLPPPRLPTKTVGSTTWSSRAAT